MVCYWTSGMTFARGCSRAGPEASVGFCTLLTNQHCSFLIKIPGAHHRFLSSTTTRPTRRRPCPRSVRTRRHFKHTSASATQPPSPNSRNHDSNSETSDSKQTGVSHRRNAGIGPIPLSANAVSPTTAEGFRILTERTLFSRYQNVSERVVQYPDGKRVSFDVLGLGAGLSVFVFPVDLQTGTTTLLREYSPGQHRVMWGFPAGMCESEKHHSLEAAAKAELSEEAQLLAGRLIPLTDPNGIAADKYSRNIFHFYLALDCVVDKTPGDLDVEEWIQVVRNVELRDVRGFIARGEMNTPNALLANLALSRLEQMGTCL